MAAKTTEKVTLIKPHRHAGRDFEPGAPLTVTAEEATWLRAQGIIDPAGKPGKAEKTEQSND